MLRAPSVVSCAPRRSRPTHPMHLTPAATCVTRCLITSSHELSSASARSTTPSRMSSGLRAAETGAGPPPVRRRSRVSHHPRTPTVRKVRPPSSVRKVSIDKGGSHSTAAVRNQQLDHRQVRRNERPPATILPGSHPHDSPEDPTERRLAAIPHGSSHRLNRLHPTAQQAPGFPHPSQGHVPVNGTAEERLEPHLEVRTIRADAAGERVERPGPRVLRAQDPRGVGRGPQDARTPGRPGCPVSRDRRSGTTSGVEAPALEARATDEPSDNRPLTPRLRLRQPGQNVLG